MKLAVWLACLSLAGQSQAQWVAFNDCAGGPGTHPNTTRYDAFALEGATNGFLKNSFTGTTLPVTLEILRSGGTLVAIDATGSEPAPGTPVYEVFHGFVDFGQSAVANNVGLRSGGGVNFTLSGLDPNKKSELQLAAVRGGSSSFANRWTLLELVGAESFVAAHSAGALTSATVPALAANQVAVNFGLNQTPTSGDIAQWLEIDPGPDGNITVVCTKYAGSVPGGSSSGLVGYAPTALRVQQTGAEPIVLIEPPQNAEVDEGQPVTFAILAEGSPINYQWFRDGEPIPGATNSTYTLGAVFVVDSDATFHVVASNQFNTITSDLVRVEVNPLPRLLLPFSHLWRYDLTGTDLGSDWMRTDYDDSSWSEGPGPLGIENSVLPVPLETQLFGPIYPTSYFRTSFHYDSAQPSYVQLFLTNLIDDAAVFYLNGKEIMRVRMPAGPVGFSTFANGVVQEAILEGTNLFDIVLLPGRNDLAVEVHQVNALSSDVVMGTQFVVQPLRPGRLLFLSQPVSQTVFEKSGTVSFSAVVQAGSAYQAQWLKDGLPLDGETNLTLNLGLPKSFHAGMYALRASNTFATITTAPAMLTVYPQPEGLLQLLSLTNQWRYQALGFTPEEGDWIDEEFPDIDWATGHAPFANAANNFVPKNTLLPILDAKASNIITYYFRTGFDNPLTNTVLNLELTTHVDDGAVFYINGRELIRHRLPAAPVPIEYGTLADVAPGNGFDLEMLLATQVPVKPEHNTLAVEVHQTSTFSSDILFATAIYAFGANQEPVRIMRQPSDFYIPWGHTLELAMELFGAFPMSFQWHKDGVAIPDAVDRELTISQAGPEDTGLYTLTVRNVSSTITSDPIFVLVGEENETWVSLLRGPYLQSTSPSGVVVRWRTDLPVPSEVRYGTHVGDLNASKILSLNTTNHEVSIQGLTPGTRYYYQIGAVRTNFAGGADYYFDTLHDQTQPVRIWAQGDSGTAGAIARRVADAYLAFTGDRETDVWLMLGDNAYGSGTEANYQDAVFDMFPELLRRMTLWPTIGNHETYSEAPNGVIPYLNIFTLPTQGQSGGIPSGTENYYSFDYANVHFVCLDSELSPKDPGSAMLLWLEADLAAHTKDWIIAYWHSPPYTKGSHDSDNAGDSLGNMIIMRENVLPILEAHSVDLVLCGHSHVYERSYLLNGHYGTSYSLTSSMIKDRGSGRPWETGAYRKEATSLPSNQGTVYVVAGSSGQTYFFAQLDHRAMFVGMAELGSLVVDIDGNRLDALFLNDLGSVLDQFTIVKGGPPEPLRFSAIRNEFGQLELTWRSVAGRRYRLAVSPDIDQPRSEWFAVASDIEATGSTTQWTMDPLPGIDALFFLVEDTGP